MEEIVENVIYVMTKDDVLISVFQKDDDEPIINPRIIETQNAEAQLTFSISIDNPKWNIVKDPENIYVVNGKAFSPNFDGSYVETLSENDEKIVNVTCYERQKLLSRKYVRAWNSTTGLERIDTFMVVILSGGDLPLQNNGDLVASLHLPGTSGYCLDALLYGTGWSTGICDVQGTFDFETDQVDIYENILKVQELWGGILVFDSVNKVVHHRDETLFLPYNGYEVKYQKNMKSLEKEYDNKIITKLCPLGESGLNIKSVNDGSEWLVNHTYTPNVYEGIENNPDITDPEQLKRWGERKLQELCKPQKHLTVNMVLLYQVEGYELETIALNDIVDVIDYNGIVGDVEQLRVVSFDYGIWDYSDAVVELSDITLESTDIFKKSVQATNSINEGTLDGSKVVLFKNGKSINESIDRIDRTIVNNQAELIERTDGLDVRVTKTETDVDDLNNEIVAERETINNLSIRVDGISNDLTTKGGNNLIKNSVGYFGNDYWEGTIVQVYDTDVLINNQADSGIKLQNADIAQNILNLKNGKYNVSFNYKKFFTAAQVSVTINGVEYELDGTGWQMFEQVIDIVDNTFSIKFSSDTVDSCTISDLILVFGEYKQIWTMNASETVTENVTIGKGIEVRSSDKNVLTRMDADGNRTINTITGQRITETTEDLFYGKNLEIDVNGQARITGLFQQKVGDQVWISVII